MDYRTNLRLRGALPKRAAQSPTDETANDHSATTKNGLLIAQEEASHDTAPIADVAYDPSIPVEADPSSELNHAPIVPQHHPLTCHGFDYQPWHQQLPQSSATVKADLAIFTSLRSGAGEGYRIVAASQGVRLDEKQELTRKSPSHGALIEDNAGACGMLAYPLPSGRYCVSHSCYAGKEHTARGGQRVLTIAVIINAEEYLKFAHHPLRLHCSLLETLSNPEDFITNTSQTVKQLLLPSIDASTLATRYLFNTISPTTDILTAHMLHRVMRQEKLILSADEPPLHTIDKLWFAMSDERKLRTSLSIGLKFSLNRHMDISCVTPAAKPSSMSLRGQAIQLIEASDKQLSTPPECLSWLSTLWTLHTEDRQPEAQQLKDALSKQPGIERMRYLLATFHQQEALRKKAEQEAKDRAAEENGHNNPS